jgi:large subunit ribosomal protein L40e
LGAFSIAFRFSAYSILENFYEGLFSLVKEDTLLFTSSKRQQNADRSHQKRIQAWIRFFENEGISVVKIADVYVKTLTGKIMTLEVENSDLIIDVKEQIQNREGYPPNQQRLIFCGRQVVDEDIIFDRRITRGSVLLLVLRLRGC